MRTLILFSMLLIMESFTYLLVQDPNSYRNKLHIVQYNKILHTINLHNNNVNDPYTLLSCNMSNQCHFIRHVHSNEIYRMDQKFIIIKNKDSSIFVIVHTASFDYCNLYTSWLFYSFGKCCVSGEGVS